MAIVPTSYANKATPVDNDSLWGYDSEWVANVNFLFSAIRNYILSGITTTNVSEWTNLYYTEARVSANSTVQSKADKSNVLELNNTTAYTPTEDTHPATKGYVDNASIPQVATDAEINEATNETKFVNPKQAKSLIDVIVTTKNLADSSVVTTYNHNLGKIPRYIEVTSQRWWGTSSPWLSEWVWNGTNQCIFSLSGEVNWFSSTTFSIRISTSDNDFQNGTIQNVTSTSFDVNWVQSGNPSGTWAVIFKLFF